MAAWQHEVAALVASSPRWMRERAAAELFVGGFTQVWLEVPVLSVASLEDEPSERTLVFFLAACLCRGAAVARVEGVEAARAERLIEVAERAFAGALAAADGDNAGLMGYFDLYLRPAGELSDSDGERIRSRLAAALASG